MGDEVEHVLQRQEAEEPDAPVRPARAVHGEREKRDDEKRATRHLIDFNSSRASFASSSRPIRISVTALAM